MKSLFNFVLILLFSTNISANEKIFLKMIITNNDIYNIIYGVENSGFKTKAFVSFKIKKYITVKILKILFSIFRI